KTLPDPTWTGPWPGWYTVDQAGDYLIAYRYADVTDPSKPFLIGGGAVPFQVRSGVQIELEPYLLSHNMVAVTADYRAMRGEATPAVLRVQLRDGDGTALVTQQADYNGAKSQAIELPLHDVPVDRQNVIVAEVLDASGQVISSVDQAFDRPADPWWWTEYEQYASQPAVPQPWSP